MTQGVLRKFKPSHKTKLFFSGETRFTFLAAKGMVSFIFSIFTIFIFYCDYEIIEFIVHIINDYHIII